MNLNRDFALVTVKHKRATQNDSLSFGERCGEFQMKDCPRRRLYQGVFGHGFNSRRLHQTKRHHKGAFLFGGVSVEPARLEEADRVHIPLAVYGVFVGIPSPLR